MQGAATAASPLHLHVLDQSGSSISWGMFGEMSGLTMLKSISAISVVGVTIPVL